MRTGAGGGSARFFDQISVFFYQISVSASFILGILDYIDQITASASRDLKQSLIGL